jgi:hypothetical protein
MNNNSGSKDIDTRDFDSKDFGSEDLDDLVVFGESRTMSPDAEKPIPIENGKEDQSNISHAPLNLDNSSIMEAVTDTGVKGQEKSDPNRITHVKTFFTKLHAGSLEFLDVQISKWLRDNPGVVIKRTDTCVGEVVAKKTEQNLVITVWY